MMMMMMMTAGGTVREDYSADGSAWDYFPHDHVCMSVCMCVWLMMHRLGRARIAGARMDCSASVFVPSSCKGCGRCSGVVVVVAAVVALFCCCCSISCL
jgi:hypothetical protein